MNLRRKGLESGLRFSGEKGSPPACMSLLLAVLFFDLGNAVARLESL